MTWERQLSHRLREGRPCFDPRLSRRGLREMVEVERSARRGVRCTDGEAIVAAGARCRVDRVQFPDALKCVLAELTAAYNWMRWLTPFVRLSKRPVSCLTSGVFETIDSFEISDLA
jgi:hypothetical protein